MTTKRLLVALLVGMLLLSVPVTFATEEGETATAETAAGPGGVSTLMFLLGAGAIVVVGGAMLARDNFKSDNTD